MDVLLSKAITRNNPLTMHTLCLQSGVQNYGTMDVSPSGKSRASSGKTSEIPPPQAETALVSAQLPQKSPTLTPS